MSLHDSEELDDDLGRWANEDLAFSTTLGVDNIVQSIILCLVADQLAIVDKKENRAHEDRYADHGCWLILKSLQAV